MDNRVVQSNSEDPIERIVNHAHWRGITLDDVEAVKKSNNTDSNVVKVVRGMCCVDPNDIASDILRADEWDRNKSQRGQQSISFGAILFLGVVMCGLLLVAWGWVTSQPGYQQSVSQAAVDTDQKVQDLGLVDNNHMYEHDEAREILESCKNNGPYQTWKDKYESNKYYYMCSMTSGKKFGIITFVVVNGTKFIKTAFSPDDGQFNTVRDYLLMQGTRFNGRIR